MLAAFAALAGPSGLTTAGEPEGDDRGDVEASDPPELGRSWGEEDRPADEPASRADAKELEAAQKAARKEEDEKRNSPEAKEARKSSKRAYKGKSRDQALAIAEDKHGKFVKKPVWRPFKTRPGERVTGYLKGDRAALVDIGGGRRAVVMSTFPLQTADADGDRRPVDLSLEDKGSEFEPANPLARARISKDVREGARLDDIETSVAPLVDAPAEGPTRVEDKVFWGNVATDTDFLLAPIAGGVEAAHHLRSVDSPERLELRFSLPEGARIRRTEPRDGYQPESLVIERDDELLATVSAPVARDAQDANVPASYEVRGDAVTVRVDHRSGDFAYPILVDPAVNENFDRWKTNANLDFSGWGAVNNDGGGYAMWGGADPAGTTNRGRGLYIWNRGLPRWYAMYADCAGCWHNFAEWNWSAPANTYIFRADFIDYWQVSTESSCLSSGIFSATLQNWEARYIYCPPGGNYTYNWYYNHCLRTNCVPGGTPGNRAQFTHHMSGEGTRSTPFQDYLAGASLWLFDDNNPTIAQETTRVGWTKEASPPLGFRATDIGLGLREFRIYSLDYGAWDKAWTHLEACRFKGDRWNRCPRDLWWYTSTGNLPDGIRSVQIDAWDMPDHQVSQVQKVNLDRTAPSVTPSGPLWDAREKGLSDSPASLTVAATDGVKNGSDLARRSGVKSIEIKVDGVVQGTTPTQTMSSCGAPDSCPMTRTYSFPTDSYSEGDHTIEVTVKDQLDNTSAPIRWTVIKDRVAPSLDSVTHVPPPPTRWIDDDSRTVTVTASDQGTGVQKITLFKPKPGGAEEQDTQTFGCQGTTSSRCPKTGATKTFSYTTGPLREGLIDPRIQAFDGVGRGSTPQSWRLKVDHAAPPAPTVSGALVASGERIPGATYDVTATADDPHSGVRSLRLKVDGQEQIDSYRLRPCTSDPGCSPTGWSQTWTVSAPGAYGEHDVQVVATDALGHESSAGRATFRVRDDRKPDLRVTGGLRAWPAITGRTLTATATDPDTGLRDIRVYLKATTALTADDTEPDPTTQVHAYVCTDVDCRTPKETTFRLPDDYPTGRYQFTVRATDVGGNVAEDRWVVAVVQTRSGGRAKLGLEQWFEFDDTDAGGDSSVYVNGETGNLVWHQVPIVNPGRGLSTVVNLSYNSEDRGGLLGIELGRVPLVGSNPDDDEVLGVDPAGVAYREAGVNFSIGIGGPTRVNEALGGAVEAGLRERTLASHDSPWPLTESRISLTDADGTQHVFTREANETSWRAPPGFNMRLRWVGPRNQPLKEQPDPLKLGQLDVERAWVLLRPDGVEHVFDSFGYLQETTDRNGNRLDYVYRAVNPVTGEECGTEEYVRFIEAHAQSDPLGLRKSLCMPQLKEVRQPTWADTEEARSRKVSLEYTPPEETALGDLFATLNLPEGTAAGASFMAGDAPQIDRITDASGRVYDLDYETTGTERGYLKQLTENASGSDDPASSNAKRVTRFEYAEPLAAGETAPRLGDLQQLTEVVPVEGGVERAGTRVEYEARVNADAIRPPDPRRVAKVTKRSGAPKLFRYAEAGGDRGASFTVHERELGTRFLTRETELDTAGRPRRVEERTSELGEDNPDAEEPLTVSAAPPSQGETTTALEWNDEENKVSKLTDAVGTPAQRETTYEYRAGGSGALTRRIVQKDDELHQTTFGYYNDREEGFVADLQEIKLPGGRTWSFVVDGDGNTTETHHPNGVVARTGYGVGGVIEAEQDLIGNWTRFYEHHFTGQPRKVVLPSDPGMPERDWRYEYDERGDVTKVIDPRGDVSRQGDSDPYVTTLAYDAFGRLFQERIPRVSEDDSPGLDGPTFAQRTRRFDRDGVVDSVVDPRNQTTTIVSDAMDQPVSVQEPGSEGTEITEYVHDDAQRLIAEVRPKGAAAAEPGPIREEHLAACEDNGGQGGRAHTVRYCLDHRGRPLASASYSQEAGDIAARISTFAYDGRGNLVGQGDPNRNTTGAGGDQQPTTIGVAIANREQIAFQRTSLEYDALDRRIKELERPQEAPDKPRERTLEYDAKGDLISATRTAPATADAPARTRTERMGYDATGHMTWQTDGANRLTCFRRRPDGSVASVTSPRGTGGSQANCENPEHVFEHHTTSYVYDSSGDVRSRSIPYAEDQFGADLQYVKDWKVQYLRDAVGNPVQVTDARNHAITNTFYDTGELRTTDRPSWWEVDWGSDEGNPDAGDRYRGSDVADVQAGGNGPTVREREGLTANAEGSGEIAGKPESLGKTDFGELQTAELPGLLPHAGMTRLRYDEEMRLTAVSDAAGKERQIAYDPAGRVSQKSWPLEGAERVVHDFHYDPNGNLERVTEDWRSGNRIATDFAYDGFDRRLTETAEGAHSTDVDGDALDEVTKFEYDANDNLVGRTTPESTRFQYGYTSLDELASESNPKSETWTYGYDGFGELTKEIAPHPEGAAADLYAARRTYDAAGQLEQVTRKVDEPGQSDPTTLTWSFEYDADGNRRRTEAPGAPTRITTDVDHDGRGLPWRTTVSGGDDERVSIVEHDANGNVRREVNPAGIAADGIPRTIDDGTQTEGNLEQASEDATVRVYDRDDLLESERLPWHDGENTTDKRYVRVWERDSARGWVTAIRLPREIGSDTVWRTRYAHNDAGWITETSDITKEPTGPVEARVKYEWDEQGNQTRWRSEHASTGDSGRDIRWTYWPNGLMRKRTAIKTLDPAGQQDDPNPYSKRTYDYLYNKNRSLVRAIDEDARRDVSGDQVRTTVFTRDAAERELRVNEAWTGGRDVKLGYQPGTGNLAHRLTGGTFDGEDYEGEFTTTSFDYDSLGRELQMTVAPPSGGGADRVTKTRWHGGGQMRERTKPNGTVDRWSWNALSEKTKHERDPESGDTDTDEYSYDDNGNRTKDERGEHRFNARDQLVWWKRPTEGGREDRQGWTTSYTLGGNGETTDKVERKANGDLQFDHDYMFEGDRLTKATTVDKTQPAEVTTKQSYRYDDAGNVQRIYTQVQSSLPVEPEEPGTTALDPGECQAADTAVSEKITRYCYDEFNRQVFSSGSGIANPAYVTYDGLDRRDRKTVKDPAGNDSESRDYAYIGTSELLVSESVRTYGADAATKRHTYEYDSRGDRQGQHTDATTGKTYRAYAKDANGSVTGLEKADGTLPAADRYDYDPYGEQDRKLPAGDEDDPDRGLSPEAKDNPFRFQGFYYDSGVKTYDMHARQYRPDVGRFLSRDLYASAAGDQALQADPLTQNRYAFAGGNPVTNIEFDGHVANPPGGRHEPGYGEQIQKAAGRERERVADQRATEERQVRRQQRAYVQAQIQDARQEYRRYLREDRATPGRRRGWSGWCWEHFTAGRDPVGCKEDPGFLPLTLSDFLSEGTPGVGLQEVPDLDLLLAAFGAGAGRSVVSLVGRLAGRSRVVHATSAASAENILKQGISARFLSEDARFGRAFYVAERKGTAVAEAAVAERLVTFALNKKAMRTLDLTDRTTARAWGYIGKAIDDRETTKIIGALAQRQGYNAIRFPSTKGRGANYAILREFEYILKPR